MHSLCTAEIFVIRKLHRQEVVGLAGDSEIIECVAETKKRVQQMESVSMREDPILLQFLEERYAILCGRLTQAAMEGVMILLTSQSKVLYSMHG